MIQYILGVKTKVLKIAYMLVLPPMWKCVVFHVLLLKKYMHDPNHILDWYVIQGELYGEFQEESLCILKKKIAIL